MSIQLYKSLIPALIGASFLAGCGGGGGGGTTPAPVVSTASFNVNAGYQNLIAAGSDDHFTLQGGCAGTATIKYSPATAATFEGVNGFSATQVSTINFAVCTPSSNSLTGTTYFNGQYVPIGFDIVGGQSSKFDSITTATSASLPANAKVGDSGELLTSTTYESSSRAVISGTRKLSYTIEPETETTAVLLLTTTSFNVSGQTLATQKSRYRIQDAASGALKLLSIDVQFSTTSNLHLVYTPTT